MRIGIPIRNDVVGVGGALGLSHVADQTFIMCNGQRIPATIVDTEQTENALIVTIDFALPRWADT